MRDKSAKEEKEVMALELDNRKQKILKAIIEEYTRTGEPVGSKRIAALLDITASPATIRNDMAALGRKGSIPYGLSVLHRSSDAAKSDLPDGNGGD